MDYKKLLFTCVFTTSNAISSPVLPPIAEEERDRSEKRGAQHKNSIAMEIAIDGAVEVDTIGQEECHVKINDITGLQGRLRAKVVRINVANEHEAWIPLVLEIFAERCLVNGNLYECKPYMLDIPVMPTNKFINKVTFAGLFRKKIGLAEILEDAESPRGHLTAQND